MRRHALNDSDTHAQYGTSKLNFSRNGAWFKLDKFASVLWNLIIPEIKMYVGIQDIRARKDMIIGLLKLKLKYHTT